tara:strand:- start:306 stop:431 length:126 start_codon:yes stop_codon:yes gene_type:complete
MRFLKTELWPIFWPIAMAFFPLYVVVGSFVFGAELVFWLVG